MKNTINTIIACLLMIMAGCTKESMGVNANSTGVGGSTARFTIVGNYLYVVDNTSLKAFDISNPSVAPLLKTKTHLGINIETIFPYQDKLFIGSSFSMHIYSLTDPEKPTKLAEAQYQTRMNCDPVVAKDSTAYATLNSSGPCGGGISALVVYDIKNISSPRLATQIMHNAPKGLGISSNALYVCDGGLYVYNTTNTFSPQYVRTITGETFFDVIPYGNILICQVQSGIALYDISDRHQPVYLSKILN